MRFAFFLVNFLVALALTAATVAAIISGAQQPETQLFIALGGLLAVPALVWWAAAEWLGYRRNRPDLERQTGLCCLFLGSMLMFAAVTSLTNGPAGRAGAAVYWSATGLLLGGTAWFLTCGMLRKRRTDFLMEQPEEPLDGEEPGATPEEPLAPSEEPREVAHGNR